jgi:uncharacterized membrane protein YdbT with pleckstrin-like domain
MKTPLKKNEKVILITRPHWFTMILPFLIAAAGLVLGIVIGGYGLLIIPAVGLFYLYKAVERKNNIWAVTNLRVIDEFGVLSNNSKESPLDKINNVSYNQTFWGKIFGFGNVQIQTAAEIGSTTYSAVTRPGILKDTITRMQEEYKENQIRKQASEMADAIAATQKNGRVDVAAELEKLYDLKQRGIITQEEFNAGKAKILGS